MGMEGIDSIGARGVTLTSIVDTVMVCGDDIEGIGTEAWAPRVERQRHGYRGMGIESIERVRVPRHRPRGLSAGGMGTEE